MTTVIGGSSPSITFSDSTTQSTAALPLTGGSVSADITVHGLTVGLGGGSVSTNTAVGTNALAGNSSGIQNVAIGYGAINSASGNNNVALGYNALNVNTGSSNVGIGLNSLISNTSGGSNVGIGQQALQANTTASNNTAVGYQAGYSTTIAGNNSYFGGSAGYANVSGSYNAYFGEGAGQYQTGGSNIAMGLEALKGTSGSSTGAYNVALGMQALTANTTASNNTAVGYQAGYSQTTGGTSAGYNAYFGQSAGYASTGYQNTLIGRNSGSAITSGNSNTLIGQYNGNQGGLDIRTSSNYIVLSDGDGNPKFYISSNNFTNIGLGGTGNTGDGQVTLNGAAPSGGGYGSGISFQSNGTGTAYIGQYRAFSGGTTNYLLAVNTSGGVYLNGASATSWSSASDLRLKTVTGTYTQPLTDISQINVIKYTLNNDETKTSKVGVTAQSVLPVVPEAVGQVQAIKGDETEYYSVSYTDLIPICISSIQELNTLVTTQATEIAALKAKVGI